LIDRAHGLKGIEFITGLTGNSILNQYAKVTVESAQRGYNMYNKPIKRYHSFEYKASSWTYPDRVVVKVEANSMGTNI
jgi:hypothetical protein